MKTCRNCNTEKPYEEFHKKSSSPDGYATSCKVCKAAKDKEYREANKEQIAIKKALYRINNKEKISARDKKYYERNKDQIAEKSKEYREANKEAIKERKQKYYGSEKGRMLSRCAWHKRRSRKKSTEDGTITKEALDNLMEVQGHSCFYCNASFSDMPTYLIHLDHYIPLSENGAHSIGNVVWSCSKCNLNKGSSVPNAPLTFPVKSSPSS